MSSLTSGLEFIKWFRRCAWNRPSQLSTPKSLNVSIKPRHTFGPKISTVVLQCKPISQSTRILRFPWRYSFAAAWTVGATLEPGLCCSQHVLSSSLHGFLLYIVITSRKAQVVSRSCPEYSSKTQAIEQSDIQKSCNSKRGYSVFVILCSSSMSRGKPSLGEDGDQDKISFRNRRAAFFILRFRGFRRRP